MKRITNFLLSGAAATLSFFYSIPVLADYEPVRKVYLRNFINASEEVGLIYGGYSKFPNCLSTPETIDGRVPIAIVCPKITKHPNSPYATKINDSVGGLFISILVNVNASRESTILAIRKVGNVSKAFLYVRYDVTMDSIGNVMSTEMEYTIDGVETDNYRDRDGNNCSTRTRTLTAVGSFDTTACFFSRIIRVTFLF